MDAEQLQRAQDAAVEAAAGRQLTPHPHGLAGRVAAAHAEAEAALDVGDIDGAISGDMLAAALSDAALLDEREHDGD